jgi:diadenosine tetraphosphatase ApaH/serine/threonine PP2A family protein phosphatase
VAAEVGRDDAEAVEMLLGQTSEARTVPADPVQTEDRRRAWIAPFVHVQLHARILAAALRLLPLLAILYDIHGNVDALDAVLADAQAAGADRYLLGGDYALPSAAPLETLERLRSLPNATWIRGNGERWLREPPADMPDVSEEFERQTRSLSDGVIEWLYNLPAQTEADGILYVHGSPVSDVESFAPHPQEGEERMLAGVRERTIVFGHSHQQFRRPGPDGTDLVNPGSVGMPLDGDRRSAWALWDGDFDFRRTEYDVERAAAAYRKMGGEFADWAARRILHGSD